MKFFKRLEKDESGATAIEYGLIAALIVVALLAIFGGTSESGSAEQTITKTSEEVLIDN